VQVSFGIGNYFATSTEDFSLIEILSRYLCKCRVSTTLTADRLPRDGIRRNRVDLKQVECERDGKEKGAWELYLRGPASRVLQRSPPSSRAAVLLGVVELRVATEGTG
jgi:hypothetical protein